MWIAKSTPATVNSLASVFSSGGQTVWRPSIAGIPVVAGTTYYFHVSSFSSSEYGSITVNVSLDTNTDINQLSMQGLGLFSNDSLSQSATLTGLTGSSIAYSRSATLEAGEPSPGFNSMWWNYTAPSTGRLTLVSAGSNISDHYFTIFTGDSVANLSAVQSVRASSTFLPVTAGMKYLIQVTSASNTGGSIVLTHNLAVNSDLSQLQIKTPATNSNDFFANRVALIGPTVSAIGYGSFATREALESSNTGFSTLWWTYTPQSNGTVVISTTGSDTTTDTSDDKFLSVWTGDSLATLTSLGRVQGETPTASFTATAGTAYQIAIGHTGLGNTRNIVLILSGPASAGNPGVPEIEISNAVRIRWPSVTGRTYQLRSSSDLQNWTNIGATIPGDGTVKEIFRPVAAKSEFFRIFSN